MRKMDPVDGDTSTVHKRKRIPPLSNHVSSSGESTTSNSSLVDDDTINEDEDGESSLDVLTIAPFQQQRQNSPFFFPCYHEENVNMDRRPRAQTMPENSSFGRRDLDEYRSPMGHLTWLASIADEEFLAARLLAELRTGTTAETKNPWTSQSSDVWTSDSNGNSSSSSRSKGKSHVGIVKNEEPASQRRRRANSVIEMPAAVKQIPVSRRRGSESEGGGSAEKQGLGVSKNKSRSKTTSSVVKASAMQRKTEGNSSGGMLAATAASSSDGICSNDDGYSAIELRARMRRAGSLGTWNLHEVQLNNFGNDQDTGPLVNRRTNTNYHFVGMYHPSERRRRIERFLEKRRSRVWSKNVKYDVRKNFADSRIRVKGRFVKKEEQDSIVESMSMGQLGISSSGNDMNGTDNGPCCDGNSGDDNGSSSMVNEDNEHA